MYIKNWKKDIVTIPNLLSIFRLVLIPVYTHIYLNAREALEFYTAGAVIAVSCLTDALDGKIARHFNMISDLGKFLDPLADKMTQFSLTLCLSFKYPALNPVLILFLVKELFQLTLFLIHLRRGQALPGALMAGKVCTTVLFISLISLVLLPDLHPAAVDAIALLDGIVLLISFVGYILAYFGREPKVQDLNP